MPGYFPVDRGRRGGAMVLLEAADGDGAEGAPLVVAGTHGRGKVMAALSASWWRLDLLTSGVGGRAADHPPILAGRSQVARPGGPLGAAAGVHRGPRPPGR